METKDKKQVDKEKLAAMKALKDAKIKNHEIINKDEKSNTGKLKR